MAASKRIYWDACVWISLIQQERIRDEHGTLVQDRYGMCRNVISAAEKNQIEIATSALSFAEVCKNRDLKDKSEDKVAAYFENDYVLPVNLDRAVGELARGLMMSGQTNLKPADACHVATALLANVDEMHSFDAKILDLDGILDKSDGTKLKVTTPDPGGKPAPLLDEMKGKGSPKDVKSQEA